MKKVKAIWYLYILNCADGSLYTGITTDVERRLKEHNGEGSSKGAKYTKGRGPFEVVYTKKFRSRSTASKKEAAIKKLSREEKLKLIEQNNEKFRK